MAVAHSSFLTAEWRNLAMLNYEIDPAVLKPHVPLGTELDTWRGRTYVSMVGFLFLETALRGWRIPFHHNFEEVNLRFYVARELPNGERRRGVVFIRELVPRLAIAWTANVVYGEKYLALPMRHTIERGADGYPRQVEYGWRFRNCDHRLGVAVSGAPMDIAADSEEEFITEHYWGYARRSGATMEYEVAHPRWRVWPAQSSVFECDVRALYGDPFSEYLGAGPVSAFLAEGSEIEVFSASRLAVPSPLLR